MNDKETQGTTPSASPALAPAGLFCCLWEWCEAIYKAFRPPKRKRLELRFLSYPDADKLIRETNGAWTVTPEEDRNQRYGWVYLELLEEYPRFEKQQNDQAEAPQPR